MTEIRIRRPKRNEDHEYTTYTQISFARCDCLKSQPSLSRPLYLSLSISLRSLSFSLYLFLTIHIYNFLSLSFSSSLSISLTLASYISNAVSLNFIFSVFHAIRDHQKTWRNQVNNWWFNTVMKTRAESMTCHLWWDQVKEGLCEGVRENVV